MRQMKSAFWIARVFCSLGLTNQTSQNRVAVQFCDLKIERWVPSEALVVMQASHLAPNERPRVPKYREELPPLNRCMSPAPLETTRDSFTIALRQEKELEKERGEVVFRMSWNWTGTGWDLERWKRPLPSSRSRLGTLYVFVPRMWHSRSWPSGITRSWRVGHGRRVRMEDIAIARRDLTCVV